MVGKRRTLVLVGVGLFFGTVALLFYIALREDPRYVSAARGLEQARAEAREAFGTLRWEEFREQNETGFQDDRTAWRELQETVPDDVMAFFTSDTPPSVTRAEVFVENEDWLKAYSAKIAPFKIHHVYEKEWDDWAVETFAYTKSIIRALSVAMIGAADTGDLDSLGLYARAAFSVIEKTQEEPGHLSTIVGISNRAITVAALGRCAVKNRADEGVLLAVESLLQELPPPPTLREVFGGQARTLSIYIDTLHTYSPEEIGRWLDNVYEGFPLADEMPGLAERFKEYWDSVLSGEEIERRRTGRRTADALKARTLEVLVEMFKIVGAKGDIDRKVWSDLRVKSSG